MFYITGEHAISRLIKISTADNARRAQVLRPFYLLITFEIVLLLPH